MRTIDAETIVDRVAELCMEASYELGDDVLQKFAEFKEIEESPTARSILDQLETNAGIARNERVPMCQDTGFAVFFVELGSEVFVEGMTLTEAINEGVRKGYKEGYLRKSILRDALRRENTGDNTPAVVHIDLVPGDKIKIVHMQKGGGSENMSRVKMLKPADGREGVKQFVLEAVSEAGPNPCPPIVVGVGIGGTFEKAAYHAKKSLLRPLGSPGDQQDGYRPPGDGRPHYGAGGARHQLGMPHREPADRGQHRVPRTPSQDGDPVSEEGEKMAEVKLTAPLTTEDVEKLNIGDTVLISGVIYTGRDAAHAGMPLTRRWSRRSTAAKSCRSRSRAA